MEKQLKIIYREPLGWFLVQTMSGYGGVAGPYDVAGPFLFRADAHAAYHKRRRPRSGFPTTIYPDHTGERAGL